MTGNPVPLPERTAAPPCLLDQLRQVAEQLGHGEVIAAAFADRGQRFILFHGKRHPRGLGLAEIGQFLEAVAQTEKEPLRAIAASRDALDFLYREVLHVDLGELPRPQPPRLLDQVRQVLRVRHCARSTEECYVDWARRYILFHNKQHRAALRPGKLPGETKSRRAACVTEGLVTPFG